MRQKNNIRSYLAAILCAAVLLPTVQVHADTKDLTAQVEAIAVYIKNQQEPQTLSNVDMQRIITDGVDWIIASQEDNGHFRYEYAPFAGEYLQGDNTVRQAGTVFALSEVYRKQIKPDSSLGEAIKSSLGYLGDRTIESNRNDGDFLCVTSFGGSRRCDLGGTALTLLAVLNYVEVVPDKQRSYQSRIDGYVQYLKTAKFSNAGFSNRYQPGVGFSEEESPFFNGEAMLALVRYYEFSSDPEIKQLLEELFAYLSTKEFESPLYLWIMAALKDMQRLWPQESYVNYATRFTQQRVDDSARRHGLTHNYCAPLEGMVSARSILIHGESDGVLKRLDREIDYWLAESSELQIQKNHPYRLNRSESSLRLEKIVDEDIAHGGFLTSEDVLTQRIDFTQHCVSAYLQKLVDIDGVALQ